MTMIYPQKPCASCGETFWPDYARRLYCENCRVCKVEGCNRKVNARGYCAMHLSRFYDRGETGAAARLREWQVGPCSVEGCDRKAEKKGLCELHYRRVQNTGEAGPPEVKTKPRGIPCEVEGCVRLADAAGLCNMHYTRKLLKGDVGGPDPLIAEDGSGHTTKKGYRILHVDGRRVLEHHYVMEQRLGRRLLPDERVHHRNGVKNDNSDDNLELWSVVHPTGQRVLDLVAFAIDLLKTYPDEAAARGAKLLLLESQESTEFLKKSWEETSGASEYIRGLLSAGM